MSGDRGAAVAVKGISLALAQDPNMHILAVGNEAQLKPLLAATDRVEIVHAEAVVAMSDNPLHAVRRRNTSLFRAVSLAAKGEAAAAVSAGNTGALMLTAKILLKMREPYRRPAIASLIPCAACTDTFTMLDLGANVDRNAEMLVDFAMMGDEFARAVKGTESPRIALLNIGTENIKGGQELLAADSLLRESKLNYVGFVEANALFDPAADQSAQPHVVVCDGFAGNVFLKTIEGLSAMIKSMFSNAYRAHPYAQFAGWVSLPVINSLRSAMDARRYGGAAFLGLRGLVVKTHGNSDEVGFASTLEFAQRQVSYQRNMLA